MFQKARIKLTFWYVIFIMIISGVFSLSIYTLQVHDLNRFENQQRIRFEQQLERGQLYFDQYPYSQQIFTHNIDLVNEARKRLITSLLYLNGVIFLLSTILAYFLSGKTLQPIADMIDSQNRFISDASHELKTPLTSLKTAFEVHLRDKKRNLKDSDLIINESIAEVDKLQLLAQSLLEITVHQKPQKIHTFVQIPLEKVILKAVKQIKPLADKKNIRIHKTITPATIFGDNNMIIGLITILLDNAIKYSSNNSQIRISNSINGKWVMIKVSDTGCGISDIDLPHIFERFYRVDGARCKDEGNSYGLGLSIANEIVNQHKGKIVVESKIDQGSIFTVILPNL